MLLPSPFLRRPYFCSVAAFITEKKGLRVGVGVGMGARVSVTPYLERVGEIEGAIVVG